MLLPSAVKMKKFTSTMNMEIVGSPQTSKPIYYQTTRRHITKDHILNVDMQFKRLFIFINRSPCIY
jgi:hypothetical protein